jgi:hypothetical protein
MANYKRVIEQTSSFNPDRYGGVYDTGLYLENHSVPGMNNNAIVRVGDTYYLVGSGNNHIRLDTNQQLRSILINGNDVNGHSLYMGENNPRLYGMAYKITDPNLIAEIKQYANETKKVTGNRQKVGTFNSDSSIDLTGTGGGASHSFGEPESNTTTVTPESIKTNTGGDGGYTVPSPDYSYYQKQIADMQAEINELKRPKSGPELAAHYGIQDTLANQGYWAGIYADDFNQYYDDLVNKQNEYRNRYARNNGTYDDYLEREYINSYNNASNARTTRGAIAANALSTGNVNDYNSSKNDNAMMQSVDALEAQRVADLAGVDYKAAQTYTDVMKELMTLGANHDASMVQDIVNQLGAASKVNAEQKKYASALASAYSTKYNGLVNARNSNSTLNQLQNYYNYYKTMLGDEHQAANAVVNGVLGRTGAGY